MDMIDVIRKAKVIAEGGMSDIHIGAQEKVSEFVDCLLYTSPSPRDS